MRKHIIGVILFLFVLISSIVSFGLMDSKMDVAAGLCWLTSGACLITLYLGQKIDKSI